jgi:hypothetical protein
VPLAFLILLTAAWARAQQADLARPPAYVPPAPSAVQPVNPPLPTPNSTWLDTSSRAAIVSSYLNNFVPSTSVATGWVGNLTTGDAGSTTQAYKDAVLLRINWFRQLAGVPTPISFQASYNASDQQAALMMSANGQLNHIPPSTWTFFSAAGADAAAQSNLCLNIPYLNDPGCIAQYMMDAGANNPEAGHRRWLLYPQTQIMGTGDVQPPYPLAFANALWVFDSHFRDARPATRDAFVAWPPRGFVPYQMVPGRWSFSYPGADFTNTTVAMQRGGGAVAVRIESPQQGYGENSVVWVPDNIDTNSTTHWPAPSVDTPLAVTVSHVLIAGVDTTFTYTVTVIDPTSGVNISGHITKNGVALAGVTVSLSGGPTAISDGLGAYIFNPVPLGTYLITPVLANNAFSPSSRSVSSNTAIADFTSVTCDYSAIGANLTASARAGTGSYSSTIAAGCPWTATSNAPWLTVSTATLSGNGPIIVNFSYPTDNGAARTAVLTISGHAVNVSQPSAGQSVMGPIVVGVFNKGNWVIDANGSGLYDSGDRNFKFQIYGTSGDKAVVGDWNGDGHAKAGIYSGGFWALDYNNNGQFDGGVDKFYGFGGNPGEIPIVGDWNGDGRTKIGYYLGGFWALDYNGNGSWDGTPTDKFIAFGGNPAAVPVIGDWNGDGRTKVGFYLNGSWYLDYNGNGQWDGPVIDRMYNYTLGTGEKPVVGDWTGSGTTKVGVWKDGFWALNNSGTGSYQSGVDLFYGFGGTGQTPVVGDWNGDGKSKIGFYVNGFWAADYNGNGHWDGTGPGGDRFSAYGGNPGESLVHGKW